MRVLELFLDSFLKQFKLFTDANKILEEYNKENPEEEEVSLDEKQATDLFNDFLGLARLLDTYQGWSEQNWTNFLMFMVQAFKEKGKALAINCVLAALGISTSEPVTVTDTWVKLDEQGNIKTDENGIQYIWGTETYGGVGTTQTPPEEEGWKYVSLIYLRISTIYTPIVNKFLEELESLLPRLLWLHEVVASDAAIDEVLVKLDLLSTYEKIVYHKPIYYSEPILSVD